VNLRDALRQALQTLAANRARSILTLFGVVWGTASVVFLMSWGEGVTRMLDRGFMKTGKNMAVMWPGKMSEEFTPASDRRWLWFTSDDLAVLRRRARLPELIAGEWWEFLPATHAARGLSADVRGIEPEMMDIRQIPLAAGRGITRADLVHRRRVAVLGSKTRQNLLGPGEGVGARFRLGGQPFSVVGVLDHVGTQLSRDRNEIDDHIWIPLTTAQTHWPPWWTEEAIVNRVLYRMPDRALLYETEAEVRAILAERLRVGATDEEAIGSYSPVEMLNRIQPERMAGVLFLIAITTLLVGGIGVATMMLDTIHERRQEIGVRLAVGAKRRDILAQIFLESFGVTALGGLAGLALGVVFCAALASLHVEDLVPLPILRPAMIGTALFVLVLVGTLAGLIPAWRATRIDPAVVLRME
jgi:putative ABC transport system permease protein